MARKNQLKIIAATSVAIFSLTACFAGVMAWFKAVNDTKTDQEYFQVTNNGDCKIDAINLYKFDYAVETYGSGENAIQSVEYLFPELGRVNKYAFDETQQKFINPYSADELEMNIYDPIEKVIQQSGFRLSSLNCNVIYEIKFQSTSITSGIIDVRSNLLSKIKQRNDIYLSDCIDFDLFLPSDLAKNLLLTKGNGAPDNANGLDGDFYVDTTNYALYVKSNNYWAQETVTTDIVTPSSSTTGTYFILTHKFYEKVDDDWNPIAFIKGQGNPTTNETVAAKGTYYVDTSNSYALYQKGESGWGNALSVTSGDGAPGESTVGSYYVSTKDVDFYINQANVWTKKEFDEFIYVPSYKTAINTSPTDSGTNTLEQLDPNAILNSTYLNTDTHDFYVKEKNGWVLKSNLDQEKTYYKFSYLSSMMASHTNFYNNNPNLRNIEASSGTLYLDTTNDDALYIKGASSWEPVVNALYGNGAPGEISGTYYVDNGNKFYKKTNSTWTAITVNRGSGAPKSTTTGTYYVDTTNEYALYEKVDSEWELVTMSSGRQAPDSNTSGDYYMDTTRTIYEHDSTWTVSSAELIYGNKADSITISNNETISFDGEGYFTIYINANYSPTRLEKYAKDIYNSDKKAVFDFSFVTYFDTNGGND